MTTPSAENSPAGSPTLRHDRLSESVAIMLALTVVQRLVGFVRGVLFCKWLDPEELGQWDLVFGFLMLAAPLAVLGLPGAFGRYLEYYRQQGQLRTFLRRATLASLVCGALFVLAMALFAPFFSDLVFGTRDHAAAVWLIAGVLVVVIVHHFLESLLMALRVFRVVSVMHFVQSVGFATLGLALLVFWHAGATSIALAYGAASVISATGGLFWLRRSLGVLPPVTEPLPQSKFWGKLLPFVAWVWATSFLANLFEVVDRYMLLHCSGLAPADALTQVGNYHSSRVVPILLVSIAGLLSSMMMPHLSHDWEAGRRDLVNRRLNLFLKLTTFGLLTGAVAVLLASPLLFGWLLKHKFAGGLEVLPWTLAYCTFYGTMQLAQTYLWCAEKARLCSLALLVGLFTNIYLNQLLLPSLGLMGAVLGTLGANCVVLLLTYWLSWSYGMRIECGTLVLSFAPLLLGFGLVPAAVTLGLLALATLLTNQILTAAEKQEIASELKSTIDKLRPRLENLRRARKPGVA